MPGRRKEIKHHLTEEELNETIDDAQSDGEADLVRRLMCLKDMYAGNTLAEAAERAGVDTSTVTTGVMHGMRPESIDSGRNSMAAPNRS